MDKAPQNNKVFPFKMAAWLPACTGNYLRWLRALLERLGCDGALSIWQEVCQMYEDALLTQILSIGWKDTPLAETVDVEKSIGELYPKYFPVVVEGVGQEDARRLVEMMPPILQVRQTFSSLNVWKDTTAYEALHLRFDGIARLCEGLIRRHGKQGELIVYDLMRESRIRAGGGKTGSVAEFMVDFIAEPEEANLFTAGLEIEIVRASEREVVLNVKECAWARYFRERHPGVGYLVACSTDEADYRAFNEHLRMQRTSTLMEGGEVCDFRIYAVE
jgi:hypothetical protein